MVPKRLVLTVITRFKRNLWEFRKKGLSEYILTIVAVQSPNLEGESWVEKDKSLPFSKGVLKYVQTVQNKIYIYIFFYVFFFQNCGHMQQGKKKKIVQKYNVQCFLLVIFLKCSQCFTLLFFRNISNLSLVLQNFGFSLVICLGYA